MNDDNNYTVYINEGINKWTIYKILLKPVAKYATQTKGSLSLSYTY